MFSLKQIANLIGVNVPPESENITISNITGIEHAVEGDISFLANPTYEKFIYTTQASVVIVPEDFVPKQKVIPVLIKTKHPQKALNTLLLSHEKQMQQQKRGIESPSHILSKCPDSVFIGAFAYIAEDVSMGEYVQIHPHAYIGKNVKIGEGTIIRAGVKIHDNTEIGCNVEIDYGAVIGSKGFGFIKKEDGTYENIPQQGRVIILDNVYIGANTTIDRATLGKTIVHQGTKIDNLVQIGHNVVIGENTIICGQVGIAGSTKIGNRVTLAGQVGIADHMEVADGITITAQSGMDKSYTIPNVILSGSPAIPFRKDKLQLALIRRLPEMLTRIEELEKQIKST